MSEEPEVATLPWWVGLVVVGCAMLCICYCARGMFKRGKSFRQYGRSQLAAQQGIPLDKLAAVYRRHLPAQFRRKTGYSNLLQQKRAGGLGVRGAVNRLRRPRIRAHAALPGVPLPVRVVACTDASVVAVSVDAHG